MPVCHGVQSFVMASRAPVFHACSVDLTWQTTVHACQRCPRAAMTPSAATAAIATQSNMEGTTSRFCPAGVHMGKCLPAQDLYASAWGPVSNIPSTLGNGLASKLSHKFTEQSMVPDASIPPTPLLEPWAPPNLPIPTTVHSKASFSPSVPTAVQSPLPEENTPSPNAATTPKQQKTIPAKLLIDKEPSSVPKSSESVENELPSTKSPVQPKLDKEPASRLKTEPDKVDVSSVKSEEEQVVVEEERPPTFIPTDITESTNGGSPEKSVISTTPTTTPSSITSTKTTDDSSPKSTATLKEEPIKTSQNASAVKPQYGGDEGKENVLKAGEVGETKSLPNDGSGASAKPLQPSLRVPQFYVPMGRSKLAPADLECEIDRVGKSIVEGLSEPIPAPEKTEEGEEAVKATEEALPAKVTLDSSVPFSRFGVVTKACGCPLYWKRALFTAAGGEKDDVPVPIADILSLWRRVLKTCPDSASRFTYLLTRGKAQYLIPDDFRPIIQDVVDTHPSLTFLQAAPDFHSRYVTTVVSRIFFCTNTSWSGRITLGELRRSNFLDVLASLEVEEDINLVTHYFSYEHFYVIYCKFWELDGDHDLTISKADLARHNNYAISERMIDRIFSGAVTRGASFKEGTMSYSDFVWFLLAEEDKRHPRSIEYWFRCMDLDGDGLLSLYELEYFYSEQSARMEEMGIEPPTLEDCLCQCLDMVRPALVDKIRLSDLKKCNLSPIFFDTFFNLPKYLQHEQRDPFSNLRDIEEGLTEVSDWDRYASEAYEMLIASEGGGGGGGSGGGAEDDDEEDEDDEEVAASPGAATSANTDSAAVSPEKTVTTVETPSFSGKDSSRSTVTAQSIEEETGKGAS
uniref:EF-hand domain-containing protein n=2 Tax=Mesocestoides corti TaxID=53468 RepID=A0A5K3ELJ0_MESCO